MRGIATDPGRRWHSHERTLGLGTGLSTWSAYTAGQTKGQAPFCSFRRRASGCRGNEAALETRRSGVRASVDILLSPSNAWDSRKLQVEPRKQHVPPFRPPARVRTARDWLLCTGLFASTPAAQYDCFIKSDTETHPRSLHVSVRSTRRKKLKVGCRRNSSLYAPPMTLHASCGRPSVRAEPRALTLAKKTMWRASMRLVLLSKRCSGCVGSSHSAEGARTAVERTTAAKVTWGTWAGLWAGSSVGSSAAVSEREAAAVREMDDSDDDVTRGSVPVLPASCSLLSGPLLFPVFSAVWSSPPASARTRFCEHMSAVQRPTVPIRDARASGAECATARRALPNCCRRSCLRVSYLLQEPREHCLHGSTSRSRASGMSADATGRVISLGLHPQCRQTSTLLPLGRPSVCAHPRIGLGEGLQGILHVYACRPPPLLLACTTI